MKRTTLIVACLIQSLAGGLRAQSPLDAVSPFVDQQVVLVAEVDLQQVDLQAGREWLLQRMRQIDIDPAGRDAFVADTEGVFVTAEQWLDQFRQAGASRMIILLSLDDLFVMPPVIVIFPAEGDARQAIARHLEQLGAPVEMRDNSVVAAAEPTLQRLRQMQPQPRPDVAEAFELVGEGPVRAVLVPSQQVRRVFEQMLPTLPAEVGGQPATVLTRGIQQAAATLHPPPDGRLELVVRSLDPQAAQALDHFVGRLLEFSRAHPFTAPEFVPLLETLRPQPEEDQLRLVLDGAELDDAAAGVLIPALAQARSRALIIRSANNIRRLAIGVHMYANDHRGQPPENLEQVRRYVGEDFDAVMINPRRPQLGAEGHVYVRPHEGEMRRIHGPGERLIIYERFDEWPGGVNIGFADGHVEYSRDHERFEQLLREARGE